MDLAPEMRLAMELDMEEEEGGETTDGEVFDSEAGTSVMPSPASTPLPPNDMLLEQTEALFNEAKALDEGDGVVTQQVGSMLHNRAPEFIPLDGAMDFEM